MSVAQGQQQSRPACGLLNVLQQACLHPGRVYYLHVSGFSVWVILRHLTGASSGASSGLRADSTQPLTCSSEAHLPGISRSRSVLGTVQHCLTISPHAGLHAGPNVCGAQCRRSKAGTAAQHISSRSHHAWTSDQCTDRACSGQARSAVHSPALPQGLACVTVHGLPPHSHAFTSQSCAQPHGHPAQQRPPAPAA
jgi:hypothetical protein